MSDTTDETVDQTTTDVVPVENSLPGVNESSPATKGESGMSRTWMIAGAIILVLILGAAYYYWSSGGFGGSPYLGSVSGSGLTSGLTSTPGPSGSSLSPTSNSAAGRPAGFDQLSDGQKRVVMSGEGVVGVPPAWPRPNIYTDAALSEDQRNKINADYNAIPSKYTNLESAANILACEEICKRTDKCAEGKYYFKDVTEPGFDHVGVCFGKPATA